MMLRSVIVCVSSPAVPVTTLNVLAGGNVPAIARSNRDPLADHVFQSWLEIPEMNLFGSNVGALARARSSPLRGSIMICLLYTSDAADDLLCVDLGGRRIIIKKKEH